MAETTGHTTPTVTTQMEALKGSKNYTYQARFHSSVDFEFLSEKRF